MLSGYDISDCRIFLVENCFTAFDFSGLNERKHWGCSFRFKQNEKEWLTFETIPPLWCF